MGSIGIIVIYVVALGLMMYFLAIKPQKKQQKAQQQLMDSIEIGDYVLTTSGFYGVIMDITDDDVIVEFGNNAGIDTFRSGVFTFITYSSELFAFSTCAIAFFCMERR